MPDSTAPTTWAVLVIDLFHSYEPDGDHLESGFTTREDACEYARARTWASVEELRTPGITLDELKSQWWSFGEACLVGGEPRYSAAEEIDYFVANVATAAQCDWTRSDPKPVAAMLLLEHLSKQIADEGATVPADMAVRTKPPTRKEI